MLAKFIEDEVNYCAIKYEQLLHKAEIEFILGLMNDLSPEEFKEFIENTFYNIDHDYMYDGIEELIEQIIEINATIDLQRVLPDRYKTVPIIEFKVKERQYGERLIKEYIKKYQRLKENNYDMKTYLTAQIKNYRNIEKFIPYYYRNVPGKIGQVASWRTLADYNSMLYNVNLTKSGWNQSIKDAQILGEDLLILNGHPNSCPICASHQGKIYSIKGLIYPSVDSAEEDGVGHPNCKCEWSIYRNSEQLNQDISTEYDYEKHTKEIAINRELRYARTEHTLYKMIDNQEMSDKTWQKIKRLLSSRKEL
jgi:hypothetical protein